MYNYLTTQIPQIIYPKQNNTSAELEQMEKTLQNCSLTNSQINSTKLSNKSAINLQTLMTPNVDLHLKTKKEKPSTHGEAQP